MQVHTQARRMISLYGPFALEEAVSLALSGSSDPTDFNWSVVREIEKRMAGVHETNSMQRSLAELRRHNEAQKDENESSMPVGRS